MTESIIVGNLEVLIQLNEDGSLNAHVFNRENDINYVGDGIGYTKVLVLPIMNLILLEKCSKDI